MGSLFEKKNRVYEIQDVGTRVVGTSMRVWEDQERVGTIDQLYLSDTTGFNRYTRVSTIGQPRGHHIFGREGPSELWKGQSSPTLS